MIHQIRKMIGCVIAICRGEVDESFLVESLKEDKFVSVPIAPSNGLILSEVLFDKYNSKKKENEDKVCLSKFEEMLQKKKKEIFQFVIKIEKERNM
jgi:tRNA U38,U39,U40 pseudouridine synthase TruA